jgi:putrescine transport system ATP-binding protein
LREQTQFELMDLQEKLGTTFVIVTHDQEEAMTVAHRIAVMNHGRVAQVATPEEIYEEPNSRWVAEFIGDVNLLEGAVASVAPDGVVIEGPSGRRLRVSASAPLQKDQAVWVALRPEKVRIAMEPPAATNENCVAGRVWDIGYLGDVSVYKVRLADGSEMKATVANRARVLDRPIDWNDEVWLSWTPDAGVALTR